MPFRYKLQKILEFRIRKKEAQLIVVQKAREAYLMARANTQRNMEEIQSITAQKQQADPRMMETYDNYIHHLWEKDEQLRQIEVEKQKVIQEEQQKLVECEMEVKVLEKHKEKCREIYKEEEKAIELKEMSEVGVQKFFIRAREEKEEQERLEQQREK
jgi:flagellar export protein FliJ